MTVSATPGSSLPLTGERTVPGVPAENYWFRRHEVVYEWLASHFTADLAGVVIDAGCGEGYGAAALSTTSQVTVGLELDPTAAAHASGEYGDRVKVVQANLDGFPLRAASVDVVVSLQVIEHLWNLSGFLHECLRVLVPGGLCVLSTPNRLTFSPGLGRGQSPTNPFHVEEFDAAQLGELVADAGFTRVVCHGLRHGVELAGWEVSNGSLVDAQIRAALSDDPASAWTPELVTAVARVSTADFEITTTGTDSCADLIIVARKTADNRL